MTRSKIDELLSLRQTLTGHVLSVAEQESFASAKLLQILARTPRRHWRRAAETAVAAGDSALDLRRWLSEVNRLILNEQMHAKAARHREVEERDQRLADRRAAPGGRVCTACGVVIQHGPVCGCKPGQDAGRVSG